MNINQYAVYQLKESAELAAYRSRSYQYLTEHHFQVIVQNYQQAYFTKLFTSDTPEMIRKRLEEHRPKNFRGRPFGVGDVIVINQQGEITAYFVDKDSLVVVAGFIRSSSSGILVTLDTKNLFIDGCAGTWMATEECVVESQHFFLMQHEVYKEKAPNVIVDASGKLVSTEIRKGLDEDARKKILDYLHGTVKETHYGVFICKRKKNTTPCAYHAVPEKMLMMVAMDQIHHLVSTMCEEEKLVKDMMRGSNLDSARSIKMKENSILFRIQEAEERRLRLYEDYKAEILDEDEYSQLKEHYIAEKQRLEHELQKQRQRALELEKRIKICDAQMERMRGILNQSEFDEELVHELIKKIYVGMDNSVEVEFKCSDPYQEVLAIMSEVQNE